MIRARFGKTSAGRLLIGAGTLALLIPAIAGCEAGNNAPTLEYHNAAAGTYTTFNGIKITNAFVLGAPAGAAVPAGSSAGLFLSVYNGSASGDTLVSAAATGSAASVAVVGTSVTLPVDSAVDLTGPQPSVVLKSLTKPLAGGSYVPVTLNFQHAGSVTLQVPVEAQSYDFSTYSAPAGILAPATPVATAPVAPPSVGPSAAASSPGA